MGQKSSINFKKSKDHQVFHNTTIRPNYAIGGELEFDLKGYPAQDLKNKIISQAIETYNKNKAPKAPKFKAKNYEWSAVVNIKPETTMDDLKKLAEHLNKKYGFQCYQITIHRDEGHINDDGEKEINHHAHLELITLDKETGKQRWNFTPKKLRELQTEVAEILQMERGIDKRISGAKRIEPRVYAEMKEKERANQKALKKELESTKETLKNTTQELETTKKELKALSANAIRKRVEQERKAWLNTNKALHEQGAEPIFAAEHYKELRELNKGAFTSLDELENALKELEKRIRKEKRQHQSNKPQLSTTQKDFKSKLIDEYYSDLSTKHDLTPFYFNKELKTLENKQKGYKIKDSENALTLTTSKKADLSEQVALMLDMAKAKCWELDSIKVTGSKAFCDEVAKQIAEIKAKEKAEQAKKMAELEQKISELEKENAELAKNRTETALETQNEPNPSKDITQSEKTQENAPLSKEQEILKNLNEKQANQTAQTPSAFDKEPEKSQKVFKEFKELCDYYAKYHFLTADKKIEIAKRASELLKNKENHELLKTYHKTHYEVKKGSLEKLAKQYEQSKGISR